MKNVNIRDVARVAGVSHSTVSRVIRDAYGVSEPMRQRIQAAIDELGYRPRVAARAMRGSTYTIGLVVPSLASPFFMDLYAGVEDVLAQTTYRPIITVAGLEEERDQSASAQSLIDRQVDALIVVAPLVSADWLSRVGRTLPVAVVGRHDVSDAYDTVNGDDVHGTRLLMEHLTALGHRRIAHLTQFETHEPQVPGTPHLVRRETYVEFMRSSERAGYTHLISGAYNEDAAYAAVRDLLDRALPVPSAIFAGADDAAFGVLKALAQARLDDEVAVVGYDNTRLSAHPRMSLTSVDQSGQELGRRATSLVLERLAGRTDARTEVITPQLIVRSSSHPALRSPAP
ncbi:LacI family DNA-binding transcriptional regulator [Microbacterium sp.]|uniref:LacI family DNA-binding transcriptional regulator n=1 Tax=Microbacterium sp. TaxID=51671 RepID=UPI003A9499DD